MDKDYLDQGIRKVPNFPKEGILFYDVTTLFEDAEAFKKMIDELIKPYQGQKIDKIVGIDARGFLLASAMAYLLGAGVSIVRKKGKLPFDTIEQEYTLEYASNVIQMHKDAVKKGEKIALIDDLLATGGTALATCNLIEELGGEIKKTCFIVDLPFLDGSKKLKEKGYQVESLVSYDSE